MDNLIPREFSIGKHQLKPGAPCLIVAEVAQAHDGSLGIAHAFIDAISNAGADAVKFQTHIAEAESSQAEPWRIRFSQQDETRYAYWKRMEFSQEQWLGLKQHADERDVAFLSSPFSLEAVDLLCRLRVPAWKIASGEINNGLLFERLLDTRMPIMLSTGMSPISEIDDAVDRIKSRQNPLVVMQCTSSYPCPPENVGLNLLGYFRDRYQTMVGLSDHSGAIFAGLAAVTLGIEVLEIHVTFSREMFGPDVQSSITIDELRQLVRGIRDIEAMKNHPVDKNLQAEATKDLRMAFMKSVFAAVDLPEGSFVSRRHLSVKKPGWGIPSKRLPDLIGARVKKTIKAGQMLREEDLEFDNP